MSEDKTEAAAEEGSLYDKIADVTGLTYDPDKFDSPDEFKMQVVRWFADEDEGDKRFEGAPEEVQEWVDSATEIAKANKSARRKKPLPAIDGLSDGEEEVAETKTKKRGRAAKADDGEEKKPRRARGEKKEKKESEGRDPTNNRYGHVARILLKNPKLSNDEVMERLNRSGHEYSEVSAGRACEAVRITRMIAIELGQMETA